MSQPMETKNDSTNEEERVYCINPTVVIVGGAAAISLNDAILPGNAKNKHMVILYRKRPKWTSNEIEIISKEMNNWILSKYGDLSAPITFSLSTWGKKSMKIHGDLYDLCLYLRDKFGSMTKDSQRIPHVELFVGGGRRGRNGKNDDYDDDSKKNKKKYGKYIKKKGGDNDYKKKRKKIQKKW